MYNVGDRQSNGLLIIDPGTYIFERTREFLIRFKYYKIIRRTCIMHMGDRDPGPWTTPWTTHDH